MRIRLIVPDQHTLENGTVVPAHPVSRYGYRIAELAGGYTAWSAIGSDGIDTEPVTVFDIDVPPAHNTPALVCLFRLLARRIGQELDQRTVYLRIDGVLELVSPNLSF